MLNRIKLYLFLTILACTFLRAETYVISPVGNDIYYKTAGYERGQKDISNLKIANNSLIPSYNTDMLLHFNQNITDAAGNYTAFTSGGVKYNKGVFGNDMSLYFPSNISHIILQPNPNTFFSSYEKIPSFTIEFYLNPARYTIDGDIISKLGPYNDGEINTYGGLRAYIRRGQLVWEFSNFFKFEDKTKSVTLSKGSYLKAGEWQHHSISYNAETGKLVKYMNGLEEEVVYVTSTADIHGIIYYPVFSPNNRNPVYIGYGYTGAIDELAISFEYKNKFNIEKYKPSSEVITKVIDLKEDACIIENINAEIKTENGSDVRLYYRAANRYFLADDDKMPWVQVKNKGEIKKVARYIQIKTVLNTDGSANSNVSLRNLSINYNVIEAPLQVTGLKAYALNGKVRLVWDKVSDESGVIGYKIYYGTKSGIYFGEISPIVIGNQNEYVVENLKNNTLYYFTISAFDEFGQTHESRFAKEVYARPDALQ